MAEVKKKKSGIPGFANAGSFGFGPVGPDVDINTSSTGTPLGKFGLTCISGTQPS